ncbi:MAG: cytochrome c [Ignavibacteriae bacterium]|nr:cytochrome c [Ignavibacteriota bacterium]
MTARLYTLLAVLLVAGAALMNGCRGARSEDPPVHLNPNMDTQDKLKPQRESRWFADGASMREQVEHTVARGQLREDAAYFAGKTGEGLYVDSPVQWTAEDLERGRQRYAIYCTPCHGERGNGRGKIREFKYPIPPTSYFDPRILQAKDGYIYEVISNGIRNMPSYKAQIPVRDRWCIVGHVRELQKAQLPDSLKGLAPAPQTTAAK